MEFASIRIITADVDRLAAFYERLLGRVPERPAPVFAQFRGDGGTLAIGAEATVPGDAAGPASNRSVIVEFLLDDVDAAFPGIAAWAEDVVQEPTTMPWGNRSALLRDPDGNLVNLFTPPARG